MSFSVVVARSFVVAGLLASAAVAQQPAPAASRGSVSGLVVDAATLTPLENATVALAPSSGAGAFPPARNGSPFFSAARVATTSRIGSYEFSDLAVGEYRLYIRRLGYEPATLDVELNGTTASQLSIGLTVVPVRLRAMRIQPADSARERPLVTAGVRADADSARMRAALDRQRAYLGSDVREITAPDVAEAATLGGSDLFRALMRLPGVSSYDDYAAELWVRGSRWDQTRVYFDGVPLLNPLHALGTVTGIGSDAIGSAVLHPGVRPASLGGEGVAMLDLRSRSGGGTGGIRGLSGLSANDVSLSLDQATRDGRAAWMIAAKRSVADLVPQVQWITGNGLSQYSRFSEIVARGDLDLGGGKKIETSGLVTRDYLGQPGVYPSGTGWGNTAGRVTLRLPFRGMVATHTLGASRFNTQTPHATLEAQAAAVDSFFQPIPSTIRMNSGADYLAFSGELRPRSSGDATWAAGYSVVSERAFYAAPRFLLAWDDLSNEVRGEDERLSYTTLWADRRWRAGTKLTVDGGMRVDIGGKYVTGSAFRPAPSLQARYALGAATSLSASVGRSYQYVQELPLVSPAQRGFEPGVWLVDGRRGLHARNDQANVGLERWTGGGFLLVANAYARRSTGIAGADPRTGSALGRPFFVAASENAHGLELSARRLTGRVTGSLAYSFGHATRESEGLRFDAPGDRRHTLDATLLARLGNFRVGGGFTAMSGLPYTRVDAGRLTRDAANSGAVTWRNTPTFDAPNTRRFPGYASLDLMADWTRVVRGARLTLFTQLPNVFVRDNLMWYVPIAASCDKQNIVGSGAACVNGDLLMSAAPNRWPNFGIRVAF